MDEPWIAPPIVARETWRGRVAGFDLGRVATVTGGSRWWAWRAGCGASHYRTPVGALLVVAGMRLRARLRR